MRLILALLPILLSSCSDGETPSGEAPFYGHLPDPVLAPVAEKGAPTLGALQAAGYLGIGQREKTTVCGDGCIAEGFDAMYLGRDLMAADGKTVLAEFACPGGTSDNPDDWTCRPLDPPYLHDGGLIRVIDGREREGREIGLVVKGDRSWTITISVTNTQPKPICLDPDFRATARLAFYDRSNRLLAAKGFRGRPASGCVALAVGDSAHVVYNSAQFPGVDVSRAGRICYNQSWSEDGKDRSNRFLCTSPGRP